MRAVLQRVSRATVEVDGLIVGRIEAGWMILLGVARADTDEDAVKLAAKIVNLRGFEDDQGKMNRSIVDAGGRVLVVSQFTLLADCREGRRPGFSAAAEPAAAETLYQRFVATLRANGVEAETGTFRATMKVELVNEGPVTFLLDSKKTF